MKKISRGATFVELLTVMAIIAIFSGFTLLNWRAGEKQYALQRSAMKLAQDIRRTEELAISTKDFQTRGVPPGGYGIYFNKADPYHYIIFADFDNSGTYGDPTDGLVEEINIEAGVKIYNLLSDLTVTFVPPDPTVKITNNASTAQIILSLKDDVTKTKTVLINKLGVISTIAP